jgi:hypothetical protein
MERTPEQNAAYYEAHRERILEHRRQRYQTDAAYKRAILKRARAHNRKRRLTKLATRTKQALWPVKIEYKGKLQDGHFVSSLTRLLGQEAKVIRRWRARGHLPAPVMRHPGNHYDLWTERQVKALHAAAEEVGLVRGQEPDAAQLAAFVKAWQRRLG